MRRPKTALDRSFSSGLPERPNASQGTTRPARRFFAHEHAVDSCARPCIRAVLVSCAGRDSQGSRCSRESDVQRRAQLRVSRWTILLPTSPMPTCCAGRSETSHSDRAPVGPLTELGRKCGPTPGDSDAYRTARGAATLGFTDVRTAIRRSASCRRAVADGGDRRQHGGRHGCKRGRLQCGRRAAVPRPAGGRRRRAAGGPLHQPAEWRDVRQLFVS